MTGAIFTCESCGAELMVGLSTVVERCPKCGQVYEVAFTAYNWHVCHPIPFVKRPGEPVSSARMNSPMAMATSGGPRTFLCETEEALEFLAGLQRRGEIEASAAIRMREYPDGQKDEE
jgi:hypothetical protein